MTHCFGFSFILYPLFKTDPYKIIDRGAYLSGPYINAEVERQYGCPNPPGMLLEGGSQQGTSQSHWAAKTVIN